MYAALKLVNDIVVTEKETAANTLPVIGIKPDDQSWQVTKQADGFMVKGRKIERFALRVDENSEEGVRRLRDIMRKMGIMKELERKGIAAGEKIYISQICIIEY